MTTCTPAAGTSIPSICYGRVSTAEQAEVGHGLDAQRERAETHCSQAGLAPTVWIADEGVSGSVAPGQRPGLARALAMLADGDATALVVPTLDRLGRNTRDVLDIADLSQAQHWRLVIVGLIDTCTPEGRAVLTVMAAMAELERSLIRRRTTEGLQAAKRAGKRLGRPPSSHTRVAGARVAELRDAGLAWRTIPPALDAEGLPRADGTQRPWNVRAARDALTTVTLDAEAHAAHQRHNAESSGGTVRPLRRPDRRPQPMKTTTSGYTEASDSPPNPHLTSIGTSQRAPATG